MALEDCDGFFGGEAADLLREELLEMDTEFGTPHASPVKASGSISDSSDEESDTDEPASTMAVDTTFDKRHLDLEEEKTVSDFKAATCGFSHNSGGPCSDAFTTAYLLEHRSNCSEMTHTELDLVILTAISSARPQQTSRTKTTYLHHGKHVCMKLFLHLHGISRSRMNELQHHYDTCGITPRIHGNTKRRPKHGASYEDTTNAVTFIENFASLHAMPLPGRQRGNFDEKYLLLPSDMNKTYVHKKYIEACIEDMKQPFKRRKFESLWNETIPHIITAKPATDLCFTCQQNNQLILRSVNLPDSVKSARLQESLEHLKRAHTERDYYKQQCKDCEQEWKVHVESGNVETKVKKMHYSYDYAQQVHFPCSPQQTGPEFFKTARKCSLFGVCCEPLSFQINYLIDEAVDTGKGADSTISLFHHFLCIHGLQEETVHIHLDNCVGQNKNNATVHYLLWRVMTGQHKAATLSFMLVGHTKFGPDRFFGLLKRQYKKSVIGTVCDIERVVKESTRNNQNRAQLIANMTGKERYVTSYQWSSFLSQFFKPIPAITSYHVFRVSADKPGHVIVKKYSDSSETSINCLKNPNDKSIDSSLFPEVLEPKGLDAKRQWYLYEQIRQFCPSNLQADFTCPKPEVPKPMADDTTQRSVPQPNPREVNRKRKHPPVTDSSSSKSQLPQKVSRKCSGCGLTGHNVRSCPSKKSSS